MVVVKKSFYLPTMFVYMRTFYIKISYEMDFVKKKKSGCLEQPFTGLIILQIFIWMEERQLQH